MQKIKEEDLILYLYNECTPGMRVAIEWALEENIELQDRLTLLRRTLAQLNKITPLSPSGQSLKTIMKHARETVDKK